MIKFIENLFKSKEELAAEAAEKARLERVQRERELDEYFNKRVLEEQAAKKAETERIAKEEEERRAKHKEAMDLYREEMKKSPEPWVELVNGDIDPDNGIQIKLDWNDAFIVYLRQNGFTGDNEDVLVQKWLIGLNMSIVDGKLQENFE